VIGDPSLEFGSCKSRLKLGGIKFVLDGSPLGRTAFWTRARKGREFDGGAGGIALARLETFLGFSDSSPMTATNCRVLFSSNNCHLIRYTKNSAFLS
jgi:hypothetical protein